MLGINKGSRLTNIPFFPLKCIFKKLLIRFVRARVKILAFNYEQEQECHLNLFISDL